MVSFIVIFIIIVIIIIILSIISSSNVLFELIIQQRCIKGKLICATFKYFGNIKGKCNYIVSTVHS